MTAPTARRSTLDEPIQAYIRTGISRIPGWFSRTDAQLFVLIDRIQQQHGIMGDLLEIGVYLGKSAALLGYLPRGAERLVVCDPFEANVDSSTNIAEQQRYYGNLQLQEFKDNYLRFHDELPEIVATTSSRLRAAAELGRTFRFIHIDGSHLYPAVRDDIELARELLVEGGVVAFDDVLAPHAVGVSAAVWAAVAQTGLRPLCLARKLYATWEPKGVDFVKELAARSANEPLIGFESVPLGDGEVLWTEAREPRWRQIVHGALPPAVVPLARTVGRGVIRSVTRLRGRRGGAG